MIKKIYFAALFLSPLVAAAMDQNNDSSDCDFDKQLVVFAGECPGLEMDIDNCEGVKMLSQDEIDELIASQAIDLSDSETSLMSYLFYPGKVLVDGASKMVKFAIQNPQQAVFFGLYYATQLTLVAAANCTGCPVCTAACSVCQCWCNPGGRTREVGKAPDILTCISVCKQLGETFLACK